MSTVPQRVLQIAADVAVLGWMDLARCQETDAESFFPEKGASTRTARAVCRGCEVRAECLDYALETSQMFGIWAGTTEAERRIIRAERRSAA